MSNRKVIVDGIRDELERDPRIPQPAGVAVLVRDGDVTLRGTVGSFHQRRAAVQAANSVAGVRTVLDELLVDPLDPRDNEIRGRVLDALIAADGVPDDRVDVAVHEAWLTLKGEVREQRESDAAFEAALSVEGVGGLTNRITVITAPIVR